MTVWATRADQVDLRGPNPHDLARSRVKAADALSGKENWVCDDPIRTYVKGTCSVSKLRGKKRSAKRPARRVRIGAPDGSLTALAGLAAVDEVTARLGIVGALDRGSGPIKQRARGLTGGQLLLGMATAQLAGQDCLTGMDRVRADAGSALLTEAPVAPSTTAGKLAGRFGPVQLAGIETALASIYPRWLALAPAAVRAWLVLRDPTIDLDASDIEVYGKTKQGVGWSYAGVRSGRVHLAGHRHCRPSARRPAVARLAPNWPGAGELLTRALAVLPAQVCGRPRVRADAGYFDATLAHTAVTAGCDFAIAAKRNPAAWRALSAVPDTDWCDARGMAGGQVAACDYTPTGWPEGTYTIIRRVKIGVEQLSADPRSRRRRTVAKDQLALALGGAVDHVWAVSFIVTNIPASHGDYVGLEAWFRNRTSIEERFREAKHGGGLNHLPSADAGVNSVWMWAGLLAGALNVMLQSLTGVGRPGPASRHPRPDADRDPATTAPGRARPAHLARPRSDPATTTRPAEPAGRPGPAAGTPRTHLTAQPYPNEQGPGDTDPDVGCFCTPTPTRTMQRQRSRRPEQDHSVSGGSRSDLTGRARRQVAAAAPTWVPPRILT